MCGIAGFWKSPGSRYGKECLQTMGNRLQHRGPDGAGYLVEGPVGLVHRRLSIIDVAGGAQPLANEDGTVSIVFNGEIYNYRELRQGLVSRGHRFTTNSDTEVLVHLYEETGENLPEHLNGMFALAIWDSRKQELFLCRDRMGEKPLYYTSSLRGLPFAFASELKALTVLPGWEGAVDDRAVADFLSLGYVPDPQTIFRNVRKLPPAHSLTVTDGGIKERRYWRPSFAAPKASFDDTVEELRYLSADAVKMRMVSDVPLGAFLSGGVDSSAVSGFMSAAVTSPVKTFSIGFSERAFDERVFARMAAKQHGTEHHEFVVPPSSYEVLGLLADHFDEPFGDSSAIPMLYLSQMTREHVTVALSGDGADELFGGYRRYRHGVIEQRLREVFPDWFRKSVIAAGGRYYPKFDYLPQVFRAKTMLGNLARELGDAYFTSMSAFRDERLDAVLSREVRASLGDYSPREIFRDRFTALRHLDPLQQMQAVDLDTYLPGDILVKTDRAAMAFSLEGRAPWLDPRLVDLSLGMPPDWKIRGNSGKHIFKKTVAPMVPAAILDRKKMGFSIPIGAWLRTSLRSVFEELVLRPAMERYLSFQEVRAVWAEHQSGSHNHERKLWNLLVLAAWDVRYGYGNRESRQTAELGSHLSTSTL